MFNCTGAGYTHFMEVFVADKKRTCGYIKTYLFVISGNISLDLELSFLFNFRLIINTLLSVNTFNIKYFYLTYIINDLIGFFWIFHNHLQEMFSFSSQLEHNKF